MRMWMIDASLLCRQHLLGEHKEIHMIVGCLRKRKNINGYLRKNIIQLNKIAERHAIIELEMIRRGYKPIKPLPDIPSYDYIDKNIRNNRVNVLQSYNDIIRRCPQCKNNILTDLSGARLLLANTTMSP